MRFNKVTILGTMLLVLLLASAVHAGPGAWGGGPCCGAGGGPALWGDLSKEQQEKMSALRLDFFKKQEALREQMAKKRIELMETASKDKGNEEAIQKKREEIWKLQDQMRTERRAMGTQLRSMLTPEQRGKFGGFGPGAGCPYGVGPGCGGGRGFGGCCGGGRGAGANL